MDIQIQDMENNFAGRTAFIAIVGRPNVGKSSLLNRMLGQKIAIVSRKPQTTRTRIMGVLTEGEDQLVFIDTPGLHQPKSRLGEYMVRSVNESVGWGGCLPVSCGSWETGIACRSGTDEKISVYVASCCVGYKQD